MKREREKHITRLHLIVFSFFVIVGLISFFVIKAKLSNSTKIYKEYEDEIVKASENYYRINDIDLEENYEKKVNIKKLYDEGLIYSEDLIKKCKGYSLIVNEGSFSSDEPDITHTAYIKCGKKYMTSGYEAY